MTLKSIWRSFQPRLSFPCPFQQSLECFRVARSSSNSWASCFLLLARYVPNVRNVAKRSIWDQCKKKYILRTDRPATDWQPTDWPTNLTFGEISNGQISARCRPINFMFCSTVGFSRSMDRMALFPVSRNPRWWLGRHLGKFKWRYLRGGSSDLLRDCFYDGVFGVGGSNGANSGLTKFNRYVGENNARGVIRLVTI